MIVGQKVVCINDVFPNWVYSLYTALPKKDNIYIIREVGFGRGVLRQGHADTGEIKLLLAGLVNPIDPTHKHGDELGFNAERFRPLEQQHNQNHITADKPEEVEA
jgi:hypothetical protein